jgi:chorismate mutase
MAFSRSLAIGTAKVSNFDPSLSDWWCANAVSGTDVCEAGRPAILWGVECGATRLTSMDNPMAAELSRLRASIDNIDGALIYLLAERFKMTQQIDELQATHELQLADPIPEGEQIARLRAHAADANLDPEFAEDFLKSVVM